MAISRTFVTLSVVLVAYAFVAQEARADFQALGVVATKQPSEMQCQDGLCAAYLSAFCLEKNRPPPPNRTAYRPAENTKVTLIVETAGGKVLRLAGKDWLRFETQTNYTGVLAIADEARIGKLGAVNMSVAVGPLASLLPVLRDGGDNPHSAEDIARATGPYRQAAEHHFEQAAPRSEAVSFAAGLINALPRAGNVSEARQKAVVAAARTAFAETTTSTEARAEVDRLIKVCHVSFPRRWHMSMRICIEYEHGALQAKTNAEFWESLGGV